jgi:hypothetical protein
MIQSPSTNVVNVQAFEEIVQETLAAPSLEAVSTAVPEKLPATVNVGVLSLVKLSVGELPRSEAIARSGVEGVAMIEALITKPVKAVEATELIPLIR